MLLPPPVGLRQKSVAQSYVRSCRDKQSTAGERLQTGNQVCCALSTRHALNTPYPTLRSPLYCRTTIIHTRLRSWKHIVTISRGLRSGEDPSVWQNERSPNLWNWSPHPETSLWCGQERWGHKKKRPEYLSLGPAMSESRWLVFSQRSVTQNIIRPHTLQLFKPCKTPFAASPFPPACSIRSPPTLRVAACAEFCT